MSEPISHTNSASSRTRLATAGLAGVAWAGVLLQFGLSLQLALVNGKTLADGVVIYLGFFTVLTNLLVAGALTCPLLAPLSAPGRFFSRPSILSGIATSITFVGLSYHLLLSHVWQPQGLQRLAGLLLHYAVPVLFVFYWMLAVPKATLRWSDPLRWSLYPIVYFIYALIRGAVLGSYPYPFIDRAALGWSQTMLNACALLIAVVCLGFVFVGLGRGVSRTTLDPEGRS